MVRLDDQELAARLTALTRDLILIPSTDGRPEERARCFEFIRIQLESLDGLSIRDFEKNDYTSLVVLPEGVDEPDVLFCGHLDVVEHPNSNSYRSEVRDGRIYGPGAGDMKGALAIMLELFRQEQRRSPGGSIGLAITSDEESGGESGVKYLVEEVGLRCRQVIVPDGGSLTELTIAEKGILHLWLSAAGRAAHASRPWLGDNALTKLTGGLDRLQQYFDELKPPYDGPDGTPSDHWFPTCSLTVFRSPNETVNRIPAAAEANLDVRFTPPATTATMLAKVRELLGPEIGVKEIVSAEPTDLDLDDEFVAVTGQVTGQPVKRVLVLRRQRRPLLSRSRRARQHVATARR